MPKKRKTMTFGDFVREKRVEKGMTARELAKNLGISPVYMCDIEKNRSCAVDELLDKLILIFSLVESEIRQMYDLVAIARKTVSPDLHNYIMGKQLVQTALREANKHQIPDEKWEQFIKEITAKEE
jgi:transcriptional regulator with XRE-family HTH domain